jgi:hypothetical protein
VAASPANSPTPAAQANPLACPRPRPPPNPGNVPYGLDVARGVVATNHQHLFCVRLDPAIDCHEGAPLGRGRRWAILGAVPLLGVGAPRRR